MGVSIALKNMFENVIGIDTLINVCIKCAAIAVVSRVCKNENDKKKIRESRRG